MTPRERILRLVLRLLAHPYRHTRRELAQHFGQSKDVIDDDIEKIRAVGLGFHQDRPHFKCAILPHRTFKELQYLQPLSDTDRGQISAALTRFLPERDALYLNRKLSSLYDFQRLGIRALRKPALERLDRLEAAKKNKRRVILENYRSNSNHIRNRLIEPFHSDAELDTLQAYDVDDPATKHFRLERIERVLPTATPWGFEDQHYYKATDVFRIANNEQVMVQLRLDVFAYNVLVEAYPKALSEIVPGVERHTFDFQSKVNAAFLGLSNFIMANAEHVEILGPERLRQCIREKAQKILDQNPKGEGVG